MVLSEAVFEVEAVIEVETLGGLNALPVLQI
jgi:hypothetical protein